MEGRRPPGAPLPRRQGGFDLVYDGGVGGGRLHPGAGEEATALGCLLGCYNPSDRTQLRGPPAVGPADEAEEAEAQEAEEEDAADGKGTAS